MNNIYVLWKEKFGRFFKRMYRDGQSVTVQVYSVRDHYPAGPAGTVKAELLTDRGWVPLYSDDYMSPTVKITPEQEADQRKRAFIKVREYVDYIYDNESVEEEERVYAE